MAISDFLFKEKEDKYLKRIEELEKTVDDMKKVLRAKDEQISYLGDKIEETKEELEKEKNKFSPKQLELIERNLKKSSEDARKYKAVLSAYKLDPERTQNTYRIELKKFYSEKKFVEIVNFLIEAEVLFVDELDEERLNLLPRDIKNLEETKKRFLDFKAGKYSWDVLTMLRRGEKLSKIYSKSKKILTVFSEMYLEFMDDIQNFDFAILENYAFKPAQIEDFKNKRDEYYRVHRVSE